VPRAIGSDGSADRSRPWVQRCWAPAAPQEGSGPAWLSAFRHLARRLAIGGVDEGGPVIRGAETDGVFDAADESLARAVRREGLPCTAEQHAFPRHVHDASGHLAADAPGSVTVDVLGLAPQQLHQAVPRALADHVPIPAPAEHSSLMR
jgi:hypothetical protein